MEIESCGQKHLENTLCNETRSFAAELLRTFKKPHVLHVSLRGQPCFVVESLSLPFFFFAEAFGKECDREHYLRRAVYFPLGVLTSEYLGHFLSRFLLELQFSLFRKGAISIYSLVFKVASGDQRGYCMPGTVPHKSLSSLGWAQASTFSSTQ